jgi:hypothetical protein
MRRTGLKLPATRQDCQYRETIFPNGNFFAVFFQISQLLCIIFEQIAALSSAEPPAPALTLAKYPLIQFCFLTVSHRRAFPFILQASIALCAGKQRHEETDANRPFQSRR